MKVIQFKLACFHDQQAQRHKTKRSRRTFPRAFVSFLQGPVCLQLVTLACPLLEGEGRRPSGPASIFLAGIDSPPLLSLPEPCRLDLSEGRRQPCRLAPGLAPPLWSVPVQYPLWWSHCVEKESGVRI